MAVTAVAQAECDLSDHRPAGDRAGGDAPGDWNFSSLGRATKPAAAGTAPLDLSVKLVRITNGGRRWAAQRDTGNHCSWSG